MKQVAVNTDAGEKFPWRLETGFHGAFRQYEIDREPVGHAIAHLLESAFALLRFARIECQPKLDKTIWRQVKFVVERFPKPPAAVIGTKEMVLDHKNAGKWFLNHNLAVSHEDR